MLSISHLPALRDIIATHQLSAQKSLGQNFLLDMNLTDKIARVAGDLSQCTVIEVGPGPGGLTRSLLKQGAQKVIAVEFDSRAITALQSLIEASDKRLQVIHGDALKMSLHDICPEGPIKVVANLPYNIATPLLISWLDQLKDVKSLTLMFQKEVAQRITACANTSAYGRLSVLIQFIMSTQIAFHLPPHAFIPAPKVSSSIVHLQPYDHPLNQINIKTLQHILRHAFGQRRKMLRITLKPVFDDVQKTLADLKIDATRRAETVTLHEFSRICQAFDQQV